MLLEFGNGEEIGELLLVYRGADLEKYCEFVCEVEAAEIEGCFLVGVAGLMGHVFGVFGVDSYGWVCGWVKLHWD